MCAACAVCMATVCGYCTVRLVCSVCTVCAACVEGACVPRVRYVWPLYAGTVLCGWYVVSVLYVQHVCLCLCVLYVLYVCARNFFACALRVLLLGSKPPGKPSKTWLEAAKKKVNDVARSRKIRTIRYEG